MRRKCQAQPFNRRDRGILVHMRDDRACFDGFVIAFGQKLDASRHGALDQSRRGFRAHHAWKFQVAENVAEPLRFLRRAPHLGRDHQCGDPRDNEQRNHVLIGIQFRVFTHHGLQRLETPRA